MAAAAPAPARPLYWKIAYGATAAFLAAIIGIASVAFTRDADARAHRTEVGTAAEAAARTIAAEVLAGGATAVKDHPELARIEVVNAGGTDEFGISTGAGVAFERVTDPAATPSDAATFKQELLNRSATLQDRIEHKAEVPSAIAFSADELQDEGHTVLFGAFAPILKDGQYTGMVGVWKRVAPPEPSVPTWRLLLALLLAFAVGWFAEKLPDLRLGAKLRMAGPRLAIGLATGLALFLLLVGQGATLLLVPTALALALGLVGGPGVASVFRGFREQPTAYVYVLPAMIGMIVLVFVPFIMGVALSFVSNDKFAGFANFKEILFPGPEAHPTFYWTLGFTVMWTVCNVLLHVSIGLSLALVLNREKLRLKGIYRVLLIIPWAVPNYITALIWKGLFSSQHGAVNSLLDVFGIEPVNWLGPGSGFWSNFLSALATNTWLGFPFMMVVTLGALQSIPKDLYEAADIDGAGRWQKFRQVTLPLLQPALIPAIILGVIWTFNMFNVIYLVSGGAPENETNILITEAYYAFKVLHREGLAAAYSLLIFFILLAYGWLQNRVTKATQGAFE
ncbi:MAG: sugar ABC transporter permease [Myxococcota bacterium]